MKTLNFKFKYFSIHHFIETNSISNRTKSVTNIVENNIRLRMNTVSEILYVSAHEHVSYNTFMSNI